VQKILLSLIAAAFLALSSIAMAGESEFQQTIRTAQTKVVKIFGAGGLRQLEAYQSGILVSSTGHVLTALSYVLDTDDLVVILHDGRKWQAEFVGSDPVTELALLKAYPRTHIEASSDQKNSDNQSILGRAEKLPVAGERLPFFDLNASAPPLRATPGERILALSNLYGIATGDEPVSVLQGVITAIAPLRARRGAYQANYRGQVYVLDAYANNPGAAGGALVDWQGRLLGILGKELRSEVTGTWLNYALPTSSFVSTVENLRLGRLGRTPLERPKPVESHSTEALGIGLIPDVLPRTPPYVDTVRRDSPAEQAGLRPDDLVVFVGDEPVDSHRAVIEQLAQLERAEPMTISVIRDGTLHEFSLVVAKSVVAKSTDKKKPLTRNGEQP